MPNKFGKVLILKVYPLKALWKCLYIKMSSKLMLHCYLCCWVEPVSDQQGLFSQSSDVKLSFD